MRDAIFIIIGIAIGGLLAWFGASMRARAAHARECAELEHRASSAEGTITELRAQVAKAADDFGTLRVGFDTEKEKRVKAETELDDNRKYLEEQKATLEEAKTRLTDAFKALSDDALKSNNEAFLQLARKSLDAVVEQAKGDIGKRQEAIDGLIKPLQESLKALDQHSKVLEASRKEAYGGLVEQLRTLTTTQQQLQKQTGDLERALSGSAQARGRWGEVTLRRVVELAGMSAYCDFSEQVSVDTEDGRLRPDLIVHLPANREIVVDAKVPLKAYQDAVRATDEGSRAECLKRHAQQTRTHMTQLASKRYWDQFDAAPDFVVMFVPGESAFGAALETDEKLIEDSFEKRVLMATPTTLMGLLRTIELGWRQEQVAKSAEEISNLGKQLYERIGTFAEHLGSVGKNLGRTNESFNKAVSSLEARVLPSARRFKELGTTSAEDIPMVEPIDTVPRALTAPDASGDPSESDGLFHQGEASSGG